MRFPQPIALSLEWVKHEFSKRSFWGLAFLVYSSVPDTQSRNDFWKSLWPLFKSFFIAHQRLDVMVIGILIIWWDHHNLVKKRNLPVLPPPPIKPAFSLDGPSLRSKTLALADEIRTWVAGLGPQPETPISPPNMAPEEFKKLAEPYEKWINRLHYGFLLRFNERTRIAFFEFGERGQESSILANAIDGATRAAKMPETVKTIIDQLSYLAALSPD